MAVRRLERRRAEMIRPGRAFVWGIGVGLLATVALLTVVLSLLMQRGVEVALSTEDVAQVVRAEVTRQAEADLSGAVTKLKDDAQIRIKAQVKNKIDAGAVRISDLVLPLPPDILTQFQGQLESIVVTSLDSSLDSLDVKQMAKEYGDRAYQMVRISLAKQLDGKQFMYSPVDWINIPVTLRLR